MKIGDRVRISEEYKERQSARGHIGRWIEQSNGSTGTITGRVRDYTGWWRVQWDWDGKSYGYPAKDLVAYLGDERMVEPDFSLDEIHEAQELIDGI